MAIDDDYGSSSKYVHRTHGLADKARWLVQYVSPDYYLLIFCPPRTRGEDSVYSYPD